jgi:hypothetical protein
MNSILSVGWRPAERHALRAFSTADIVSPNTARVSFETTRLSAQHRIEVYAQLVPIVGERLQLAHLAPSCGDVGDAWSGEFDEALQAKLSTLAPRDECLEPARPSPDRH